MTSVHRGMAWNDAPLSAGPVPLWFQIAALLRGSIASGEFKPGEHLPSEAELNRAFGVSRTTARAALDKLEQEGLIKRQSGRGSTVLDSKVEQPVNLLTGFAEDMRRRGLRPSYATMSAEFVTCAADVGEALGIDDRTFAFRIVRLLSADESPIALSTSWLAPSILAGREPPARDYLDSGSLYAWLEQHCGTRIAGGHEFIEATNVRGQVADHLGVKPGTAALVARRLSRSASGAPVEYAVVTYRADRYRFRLDLASPVK